MNALSGITERQKFCLCNVACEVVWYCLTAGKISSGRLARTGLDVEWNLNGKGLLYLIVWVISFCIMVILLMGNK